MHEHSPSPPRSSIHRMLATLCLVHALAACGDDDDDTQADDAMSTLAFPTAVGPSLLLVDTGSMEALILDVDAIADGDDGPRDVKRIPLHSRTLWAGVRNDSEQALILSAGLRGVGQGAVLVQISADGQRVTHALGAAFNAVTQSDDGRFAIAYYKQGSSEVAFSPNEFGVVDLDSTNPSAARLALNLPGGAPLAVLASPAMRVAGSEYYFAVVLSDNHVTLLDLERPDGAEIVVELGAPTGEGRVTPQQVLFDARGGRLLVRCSNSDDLFVLTLEPADADRENRVWPSIDVLPAGEAPADMATFGQGDDTRVLAVSETGPDVRIVQLRNGTDLHVPMDIDANRVLGFMAGESPQALLFRIGSPWVALADVEGLELDPAANTRELKLEAAVQHMTLLEGRGLAIVDHGPGLLGVLDLLSASEQLIGIHGGDDPAAHIVVSDAEMASLWFGTAGQHLAGFVVLDTGRTGEVLLQEPIAAMTAIPLASRIAIVHHDGSVTLVDSDSPTRSNAVRVTELR